MAYIMAAAILWAVQNRNKNIAGPIKPKVVISRRTVKTDHLQSINFSA